MADDPYASIAVADDPYEGIAKAKTPPPPDLSGPAHAATRRDALAQPGITPAMRVANPINQDVMKGIAYTPTVAGTLLPGLDVLAGGGTAATVYGAGKAIVKPLAKSVVGAAAGGLGGRELGGLVGFPEAGEKIGTVLGGLYGGFGGTVPSKSSILKSVLKEEPTVPPIPSESMPPRVPSVGGTLSPQQTVESAGGVYVGKGVTGHEIKLPESMTKNLPVPDTIKRNISVTIPEDKLTVENIKAAMEHKADQFSKPLSNTQIGRNVEAGVKEAAGTPTLRPGVSLRNQAGTVGAKTVTAEPNTELTGPKIQTPSRSETMTENLKNRVPGSNPIEPRVKVGEQPASHERTPAEPKEETVHPMTRQSIHVNGAQATQLTEGKPGLRNDLLDLEGEQLREVLRKSGENMEHIQTVGRSAGKSGGFGGGKITDPNNISRQEAFDMLFEKGYTPEQIVKEAPPRSKPAPLRKAFGPPLKNPLATKDSGL